MEREKVDQREAATKPHWYGAIAVIINPYQLFTIHIGFLSHSFGVSKSQHAGSLLFFTDFLPLNMLIYANHWHHLLKLKFIHTTTPFFE